MEFRSSGLPKTDRDALNARFEISQIPVKLAPFVPDPMNDGRGKGASEELPRIQQAGGIERLLERLMHVEGNFADRLAEPAFFGESDAVFAGDRPLVFEDPSEKQIQRSVGALLDNRQP